MTEIPNGQSKFMVVNVAWNHSGWARLEPNPKIGFGYVKRPNSAAFSPHEALNFDFCKKNIDTDDAVFGYFQTRGIPRKFVNGGLIFFWSKSTVDRRGYFIGVYGNAEILNQLKKHKYPGFENDQFWANIRGEKKLSCLFPCYVEDSAYITYGKRLIYRSNFTYDFNKANALRLLTDVKNESCGGNSNSGAVATLTAIEEYVRDKL